MSFIFLLCASIISSLLFFCGLLLLNGKYNLLPIFLEQFLPAIIITPSVVAFPGLIIYCVIFQTLWRKEARLTKTALIATLIATLNGMVCGLIIVRTISAGSPSLLEELYIMLLASIPFAITGFCTGALHYLFYKKWCDYRAKTAAS